MELVDLNRDYVGKDVFVGIDVHKKTYVVSVRCENEVVKKFTQTANPDQLSNSLLKWFKGAKIVCVYEAGFSGFGLYRALCAKSIGCILVNPASVEVAANNRVKTDKRDSNKLSEKLEEGKLEGIYVPSVQEELDRQYQRTRAQLVRSRTRVANQLKGKLNEFGMLGPEENEGVSERFIAKVKQKPMSLELKFCLELIVSQWQHLTRLIKDVEVKIRDQARSARRDLQILQSVPGIGMVSAVTIATELVSFLRFKNERSIFAFLGLTPGEYSSGEHRRLGNITRQGSNRLRWILTEAAWRAIREDEALKEIFDRIATKRGKKKAIVAIARKLAGRIRSCIWNDIEYATGTYA